MIAIIVGQLGQGLVANRIIVPDSKRLYEGRALARAGLVVVTTQATLHTINAGNPTMEDAETTVLL